MRITFARHGESEANLGRVVANRGLSHPLTPSGRRQARELAEALTGRGVSFVYVSPLLRAIETGIVVAHALAVPLAVEPALREFDMGVYEGRSDHEAHRVYAVVRDAWLADPDSEVHPEGGERLAEVRGRLDAFLAALPARHTADAHVVCVGHGGLFRVALPDRLEPSAGAHLRAHGVEVGGALVVEA
ncbi:MAG: histidine phosphatase family protein [Trueperaceae bacterium]|nr:histidine phosphatase family protein [Trueperaceae bacterium]